MKHFTRQSAETYETRIKRLIPGYELLQDLTAAKLKTLLPENASLLIAGAGTGMEIRSTAKGNNQWRYTAVDLSPEMLGFAKEQISNDGLNNDIDYFVGDMKEQSFTNTHDGSLSLFVLHFVADDGCKLAFLKKIRSSLKDNSYFISADLTEQKDQSLLNAYHTWLKQNAGHSDDQIKNIIENMSKNFHPLSTERYNELLGEAGFQPASTFFQSFVYKAYITAPKN